MSKDHDTTGSPEKKPGKQQAAGKTTPATKTQPPVHESPDSTGGSEFFAGLDAYIHSNEPPTPAKEPMADPQLGAAVGTAVVEAAECASTTLIPGVGSMALQQIERSRRPQPETLCETCPAALWFVSPGLVRCYCRIMHLVIWSTDEQNQITHCDGPLIASQD